MADRFEEILAGFLYEQHGAPLKQIAERLGIPATAAKQDAAMVVQRLIEDGPTEVSVADLEQRSIHLKTVRLPEQRNGNRPFEPMTFAAFDPFVVAGETWDTCELRRDLRRLLIVVTRGRDGDPQRNFKIDFGFFWSPSAEQTATIRREWEEVRRLIAAHRADDLPREAETEAIHVKPKGTGAGDRVPAPGGIQMRRSGFALNARFVETLVDDA